MPARTAARRSILAPAALLAAALGAADPALACTPVADPDGVVFPISATRDGRRLQDAEGRPFLLHGDTAWSLIGDLSREDADRYLRDRRARGFNTLLVNLLEQRYSRNAPANAYGAPPFTDEPFGALGEAYFDHAHWILDRACELGFLVLLAPAYAGHGGGPDGWHAEMARSGTQRLFSYGHHLGERFGAFRNIVWMHGGDYDIPDMTLPLAVREGLIASGDLGLHAYHGAPETRPLEFLEDGSWLSLNTLYTYGEVSSAALGEWRRDAGIPFILIESAYENEHGAGALRVRIQAWHAILSGAAGHVYGNNPIWHFDGPGLHPAPSGWSDQLDSAGAQSMTALRAILEEYDWSRLEPRPDFLVSDLGSGDLPAAAAVAEDGTLALVYLPTPRRLELDLVALAGDAITVAWRDPTSGRGVEIEELANPRERRTFTPPPSNGASDSDWVLVLRATTEALQ